MLPSRPDISADRIRERNRHHSWLLRLPVFLWLVYLFVRYLGGPSASSVWGGINLAFHEIGHILFSFLPEFWMVAGGTLTEMAIPLVAAALFIRQKEDFGAAVALFWFATVLMGAAVYAGDARARALPLVSPFAGDSLHDWYYMLGRVGLLQRDHLIGSLFRTGGLVAMAAALLLSGRILWLMATDPERTKAGAGGEAPLTGESALEAEGRRFQAWLQVQSAAGGSTAPEGLPGIREVSSRGSGTDRSSDQIRDSVDPSALTPEERRFLEFLDREGSQD